MPRLLSCALLLPSQRLGLSDLMTIYGGTGTRLRVRITIFGCIGSYVILFVDASSSLQQNETAAPAQTTIANVSGFAQLKTLVECAQVDSSDIEDAAEALRKENDRATALCARADFVVKFQESELSRLRERNTLFERKTNELESSNRKLTSTVKNLEISLGKHDQTVVQIRQV